MADYTASSDYPAAVRRMPRCIGSITVMHEISARWIASRLLHQSVNCIVIQAAAIGEADFINAISGTTVFLKVT